MRTYVDLFSAVDSRGLPKVVFVVLCNELICNVLSCSGVIRTKTR